MKAKFSKRMGAYLIDILLLMLVIGIISPIIPKSNNVNSLMENTTNVVKEYMNKEISKEEFMEKSIDINYDVNRATYLDSIFSIILYLLYFTVLPLFINGQTFGKKLMKLRVVKTNGEEVNTNNLLLRALLLYGIASSIISLVLLLSLSKSAYLNVVGSVSTIFGLANLISLFMIIIRKDGRGLHDLLGKTKVIPLEGSEA